METRNHAILIRGLVVDPEQMEIRTGSKTIAALFRAARMAS